MNPFEVEEAKFEQGMVRLRAAASVPRIQVAGLTIGPADAGERFEAYRWVAEELVESGLAQLEEAEPEFTMADLQRVRLLEAMQQQRRPGKLPSNFYTKLRRLLRRLRAEAASKPEKIVDYEKAYQWALDMVALRLNKVLYMASAASEADAEAVKNLTEEELALYRQLHQAVERWRSQALP